MSDAIDDDLRNVREVRDVVNSLEVLVDNWYLLSDDVKKVLAKTSMKMLKNAVRDMEFEANDDGGE